MKEIFHRTSIRKFDRRPVEDEKIEKLLRAAMAAPSAGNQQPWAFFVVREKDLLSRLAVTPFLPVASDGSFPVCRELELPSPQAGNLLQKLQQRGL